MRMILLLGLLISFSASAGYSLDTISSTLTCPKMKAGKYKGQCIDTTGKRAVKILEHNPDSVTFLNFRKQGVFYKAVIPLNQVESMSYLVVDLNAKPLNFLSIINVSHNELRVRMKPGSFVGLFSNTEKDHGAVLATETDFVISMNYMAPAGVPYDPVKGFNEDLYGSVLQVFSTRDEVRQRFEISKLNVYEIDLTMAPSQAADVLQEALIMSDRAQYTIPYDSWTSNCTTMVFDLLDAGLFLKNQKPYRFNPLIAYDTGLAPAFRALEKRKLVLPTTTVELLNTEFGYKIFPSKSNRYFNSWIGKTLP